MPTNPCERRTKRLRALLAFDRFMSAFAEELDCKYIFCTDCSTVFDAKMLAKLTE